MTSLFKSNPAEATTSQSILEKWRSELDSGYPIGYLRGAAFLGAAGFFAIGPVLRLTSQLGKSAIDAAVKAPGSIIDQYLFPISITLALSPFLLPLVGLGCEYGIKYWLWRWAKFELLPRMKRHAHNNVFGHGLFLGALEAGSSQMEAKPGPLKPPPSQPTWRSNLLDIVANYERKCRKKQLQPLTRDLARLRLQAHWLLTPFIALSALAAFLWLQQSLDERIAGAMLLVLINLAVGLSMLLPSLITNLIPYAVKAVLVEELLPGIEDRQSRMATTMELGEALSRTEAASGQGAGNTVKV
jgi:hypothetical protein